MNCPDIERLISFALDPLNVNNEEIACHINGCACCKNELLLVNQLILCKETVFQDDIDEIRIFLSQRKKSNDVWEKLKVLLVHLPQTTHAEDEPEDENIFGGCDLSVLTGVAALSAVSSASKGGKYVGEPVKIGFAANCYKTDNLYWYAEILIPPGAEPSTMLMILVTDSFEDIIEEGTLVLLGVELPIKDGVAQISLETFRNNLNNPNVKLRYPDRHEVEGNLVLC